MRQVTLLTAAALLTPAAALAHHTTVTSRAGGGGSAGFGASLVTVDLPRIDTKLSNELLVLDRWVGDTASLDTEDAVWINMVSAELSATFDWGTSARLRLPVGVVWVRPESAPGTSASGIGDIAFDLSQVILRGPVQLRARVGLSAPTGRYDEAPAFTNTGIVAGEGGAINSVTYDTRASLGAGSWSGAVGLDGGWQLHPRLGLGLGLRFLAPFDRTSDGNRWGFDLVTQAGLTYLPVTDKLALQLTFDHRHHTKDSVPGVDEATGELVLSDVGGRDELGVGLGLDVAATEHLQCGLRLHAPLWQRAGDVQLVETFSAQLGCGYAFSL